MKFAITGGTGFVGRNVAKTLLTDGHEVVLVARGRDRADRSMLQFPGVRFFPMSLNDSNDLAHAFEGCDAVAHCAGINREIDGQTFQRVHVEGTRHVIEAARRAGVGRIVLMSFLRARPNCGSSYHESKWAAEEIVRQSGLNFTILKCGVIYGKGDHMLDHLSHAFYTFPLFAFVGLRDKPIRPNAVEDVARIIKAALVNGALSKQTVAVLGPETLTLRQAVRRVAGVVKRKPLMFRMPVRLHYIFGWFAERIMKTPVVSVAQVQMLFEGLAEPQPACPAAPAELAPAIPFTEEQIRIGLPASGPFRLRDNRCCCCHRVKAIGRHIHSAFFELP